MQSKKNAFRNLIEKAPGNPIAGRAGSDDRAFISVDKLCAAGSFLGFVSLFASWFVLKPNRLASGVSLNIVDSAGVFFTIILALLWALCFCLAFIKRAKFRPFALGLISNTALFIVFILLGSASSRMLEASAATARVSLGAGVWISFLAAYLLVFSARKGLKDYRILKNIFTWAGPLAFAAFLFTGYFNKLSVLIEYSVQRQRFIQELLQHIFLVTVCVFAGSVIGVLLGIWATRNKKVQGFIFFLTNISQTIPSLALFGLLIAPLSALSFRFEFLRDAGIRGIGNTPAIIALVIYSLLPVVRNTYTSIKNLDKSVIDAGRGMGMSRFGIFYKIEMPLSAPLIIEGIRIAAVQSVGLAAVAALIGAGGLGWFIFQGLGQAAPDMVLLGAIPIIMLALFVDGIMRLIVAAAVPKALLKKEGDLKIDTS